MWEKLHKLLKTTWGKVLFVFASFPLWRIAYNAIDAWGNAKMITDSLPSIWRFFVSLWGYINTTGGSLVVMLIGFGLIALQLHRQERRRDGQETGPLPKAPQLDWLDKRLYLIAEQDRAEIQDAVIVCGVQFRNEIEFGKRYVDFVFSIFNQSLYEITPRSNDDCFSVLRRERRRAGVRTVGALVYHSLHHLTDDEEHFPITSCYYCLGDVGNNSVHLVGYG